MPVPRLLSGLCLVCGALGIFPQAGGVPRLSVRAAAVVWLDAGSFEMGAEERDVQYAVRLCRASRRLDLDSPIPATDGACSSLRFAREMPRRREWTAAYGIDRDEVTFRRWRRCVIAGRCAPSWLSGGRLASPELPVAGVTWRQAQVFCEWAGGRLPTEVEWERAARGGTRSRFPWGRHFNDRLANYGRSPRGPDPADGWRYAAPVGSFPDAVSPYGLHDMAGNVFEWTDTPPRASDVGLGADAQGYRIIRGGSWSQPPELLRVTSREWSPIAAHRADIGLRCAYDQAPLARGGRSAILRRP